MSGNNAEHLISMANDIANFFHSESDRQIAIDGIVGHIQHYWEPRMRRKMLAQFAEHGGEDLNDLARAAIEKMAQIERAPA